MTPLWQEESSRRPSRDIGPWLLCLDLQREFVVEGRPLCSPGVEARIAVCRSLLEFARQACWPVLHVHRHRDSGLFSERSEFARPVVGLEPLASEPLYFRSELSAFASPNLRRLAPPTPGTRVVLVALSLDNACVATVLQGADIGLKITVAEDAIGASALGPYEPGVVAGVAKRLIAPFARFERVETIRREAVVDFRSNPQLVFEGN
jgi:nicotinamidase-related amidase